MRPSLLISSLLSLFVWLGSLSVAKASHTLGAELVYEYIGTTASPNRYRVSAYVFNDFDSIIRDFSFVLTCGKNECGNTQQGSFTTELLLTRTIPAPIPQCAGQAGGISYEIRVIEAEVDLPPARWTLSINPANRRPGVSNLPNAETQSLYVAATLDNSAGLTNSSPKFTSHYLIQLIGNQPQRHSWSTFDTEGDSLAYELVSPMSKATPTQICGAVIANSTLAPHFVLNAATGELLTRAIPVQQGNFILAVAVNEYRRINGTWQQIGQINRDMVYQASSGSNQVPVFSRIAFSNNPTGQLLGQPIRVNQGQNVVLNITATDPDAGQTVQLVSELTGVVPGATFQTQGNGQGQLTWQVPAQLPLGRYTLSITAVDDACPGQGVTTQAITFLISPAQALATRTRQALAQPPYPSPFREEVRFQFAEKGAQPVVIFDELGRTVAQLLSAADGSISWRPASTLPAGLYLARNPGGTQVVRLAYAGQ